MSGYIGKIIKPVIAKFSKFGQQLMEATSVAEQRQLLEVNSVNEADSKYLLKNLPSGDNAELLSEIKKVDGFGSGIDADLLRGLPADFTASKAINGYQKLPSGLIIQWGKTSTTAIPNGGTYTITLPITFPTAFLTAVVSSNSRGDYSVSTGGSTQEYNYNTSQFTVAGHSGANNGVNWIAIGH